MKCALRTHRTEQHRLLIGLMMFYYPGAIIIRRVVGDLSLGYPKRISNVSDRLLSMKHDVSGSRKILLESRKSG